MTGNREGRGVWKGTDGERRWWCAEEEIQRTRGNYKEKERGNKQT